MIIDESIPGWSDVNKLRYLAKLATRVPEDGWIVEIGSFCGRSAYALGMNKKQSVKLTCFDQFPYQPQSIPNSCYGDLSMNYCYEAFLHNMREVENLETGRIIMPLKIDFLSFTKQIDLIFIDCVHTYDAVKADIDTWFKFMKPGGVMVFDDYFDMFPGTIRAVDEFVAEVKPTTTQVISSTALAVYL